MTGAACRHCARAGRTRYYCMVPLALANPVLRAASPPRSSARRHCAAASLANVVWHVTGLRAALIPISALSVPKIKRNRQKATQRLPQATAEKARVQSAEIKIEQVRALIDFCSLSAHRGGRRVVVLAPAESLNAASANALLKTLEE